jgi:hypothetical protein
VTKIGINFPIVSPSLEVCLEVNSRLDDIAESFVRFGDGGNSSPHVTVAMGTLNSESDLDEIKRIMRTKAMNLPKRASMSFGGIYREILTGHYIFSDISFSHGIGEWRLEAQKILSSFFSEAARTSEVPHLTVGHISSKEGDVDSFLKHLDMMIPSCPIPAIDIAVGGPKGIKGSIIERIFC